MKQDDTAGKILLELLERGVITEENEYTVFTYLQQAYASGYDEGRLQTKHRRPVGRYSSDGKLIKTYPSISAAARAFGVDKTAISKAVNGRATKIAGYNWKFINIKDPTSASKTTTVGSYRAQQSPPKPKTRSSKKG